MGSVRVDDDVRYVVKNVVRVPVGGGGGVGCAVTQLLRSTRSTMRFSIRLTVVMMFLIV